MIKTFPYLTTLVLLSACTLTDKNIPIQNTLQVDELYINGVIWTGEEEQIEAEILAVKNCTKASVGNGTIIKLTAETTIDLEGYFLMPGFSVNHVHFFEGGRSSLASVDLRSANSPEVFSQRIIEFSKTVKP